MKLRYAFVLPLAMLAACGGDPQVVENVDSNYVDTNATVEIIETNSSLPTPFRVAAMFKRSELSYLPGLTFDVTKVSNYSSTFQLAQIMGVYSADMAYSVLNKQTQEGQLYLKTVREVGNKLNLSKVFDQSDLFDRFNNNMENEDSIGAIVAEIQYQTDLQLEENQQNELYGVIFAGACQSYYEGIMMAGANFASSPARILIDFMDPIIVAEKIAVTDEKRFVTIKDIENELRDGQRGVSGTGGNGKKKLLTI